MAGLGFPAAKGLFLGALSGLAFFLLEITVRLVYLVFWTTEQAPVGYIAFLAYYMVAGALGGLFGLGLTGTVRHLRSSQYKLLRNAMFAAGIVLGFALFVLFIQMTVKTELSHWQILGHLATITAGIAGFLVLFSLFSWQEQRMGRGRFLKVFAIVAVLLIVGHMAFLNLFSWERVFGALPASTAGNKRPNILLLSVDTLRADHVGAYGYKAITPNIDRIAASGTLFENAIAASGWTRPSFGSILTSTYPSQHGGFVVNDPTKGGINETWADMFYNGKIRDESLTLAEILKQQGYVTIALQSNWQAGSSQNFDQGFDLFLYDAMFEIPLWDRTLLGTYGSWVPYLFNLPRRLPFYNTPPNADEVYLVYKELLRRGLPEPFFLWINLMDPHSPYLEREQGVPAQEAAVTKSYESWETEIPDEVLREAYDMEISYTDYYIGQMIDALDSNGQLDHTVLAFLSDHGEDFGDHHEPVELGGGYKIHGRHHGHSVYQELLHVPLILRYPPAVPKGRRIASRVCMIDLLPSLLDLAGIDTAATGGKFEGESFVGKLSGAEESTGMRTCFSERTFYGLEEKAVLNGDSKLILRVNDQMQEMYDIKADPHEQKNLVDSRAGDAGRLRTLLDGWMEKMPVLDAEAGDGDQQDLSEQDLQQLRSLGYIR
jgi:arylsulfatase A-like enzyme